MAFGYGNQMSDIIAPLQYSEDYFILNIRKQGGGIKRKCMYDSPVYSYINDVILLYRYQYFLNLHSY